MSSVRPSDRDTAAPRPVHYGLARYWHATQEPLYCLLFLLPLVITYEFSAMMVRRGGGADSSLVAQWVLSRLLGWFGATGTWLPALALVLTLLVWHLLVRAKWHVHPVYFLLMLVESAVLTLPLFVLGRLFLAAGGAEGVGLPVQLVEKLGAGIFEELVFRLYLITALLFVTRDLLRWPRGLANGVTVAVAAALFALAHFDPVGRMPWDVTLFAAYLVDGVYLSLVFIGRGLGICTGCHAAYNLTLVLWGVG
jgi:hypothetical protein